MLTISCSTNCRMNTTSLEQWVNQKRICSVIRKLEGRYSTWVFPKIGVPPKHPKMIIFSRKTYGCWVPPFLETSTLTCFLWLLKWPRTGMHFLQANIAIPFHCYPQRETAGWNSFFCWHEPNSIYRPMFKTLFKRPFDRHHWSPSGWHFFPLRKTMRFVLPGHLPKRSILTRIVCCICGWCLFSRRGLVSLDVAICV